MARLLKIDVTHECRRLHNQKRLSLLSVNSVLYRDISYSLALRSVSSFVNCQGMCCGTCPGDILDPAATQIKNKGTSIVLTFIGEHLVPVSVLVRYSTKSWEYHKRNVGKVYYVINKNEPASVDDLTLFAIEATNGPV